MRKIFVLCLLLTFRVYAQSPDLVAHRLTGNSKIALIQDTLNKDYESILADATRFVEDPAKVPAAYVESLQKYGLDEVKMDPQGNVIGLWKGSGNGRTIVMAVRLPGGAARTDGIKARMEDTRLFAPGIADNYSLAVMLSLIRALKSARVETTSDILFISTANGDSEKRLLESETYQGRIHSFVALQAIGPNEIVNASPEVGRYRVRFQSRNASRAAEAFVTALKKLPAAHVMRQVAAPESSVDVELWSESSDDLDQANREMNAALERTITELDGVQADIQPLLGETAARTHVSLNLVQLATAVIKEFALEPVYRTDVSAAAVPMRLGIPSIALGCGASGGDLYTTEEWIDIGREATVRAATVAVTVLLSVAGMK